MPLHNHLALYAAPIVRTAIPIRRGDVVFCVSQNSGHGWAKRRFAAHAGICAKSIEDYQLSDEVTVLEMIKTVGRRKWPTRGDKVDLSGSMPSLGDRTRTGIIDEANSIRRLPVSLLAEDGRGYWMMGDASFSGHKNFPDDKNAYALSCSWFVQLCYQRSLPKKHGGIVNTSRMPPITRKEHAALVNTLGENYVQDRPLCRLYTGYLIGAFEADEYPFSPSDWSKYKDYGKYVPQHMRVDD